MSTEVEAPPGAESRRASPKGERAIEEPLFGRAFAALLVLFVAPIWMNRFLPMVDVPGHLGVARMFRDLGDPASPFHAYFLYRPGFTPYVGYIGTLSSLASVVSIEVANKLFLTLCVAGLPLSVLGLLRALGHTRWLALLALPLPYTLLFFMGFVNTLASSVAVVASLWLYASRMQGGIPGAKWSVALVIAPLLSVLNHPHPYTFLVCGILVFAAAWPKASSALAYLAPSAALAASWLVPTLFSGPSRTPWQIHHDSIAQRIDRIDNVLTNAFQDPWDVELLRAWALLLVAALVLAIVEKKRSGFALAAKQRTTWVALVLLAGAAGGYFLAPRAMLRGHVMHLYVYDRYALLLACFALTAIPLTRATRALRIAIVALVIVNGGYLYARFASFDDEASGFESLAERVEAGTCIAPIFAGEVRSAVLKREDAFSHFDQYFTVWKGLSPGYPFAIHFQMPVAIKRADGKPNVWSDAAYPLVWPHEVAGLAKNGGLYARFGGFYRYFLLPASTPLERAFGADAAKLTKVGEGGPFALYENPAGTCGRTAP